MLPSDLAKVLPQGLSPEALTEHGVLRAGLESSMGEVHLALFGARLLLMTRANTFSAARCEEVNTKPPPALLLDGLNATWKVSTPQTKGRRDNCYAVSVPSGDVGGLLALMDRFFSENNARVEQTEVIAQRLAVSKRTDERVLLCDRYAALLEQQGQWAEAMARRVESLQLQSYQPPKERVQAAVRLYATQPKAAMGHGAALAAALLRAEQWEAALSVTRLVVDRDDAPLAELPKLLQARFDVAQRLSLPQETLWTLGALIGRVDASAARRWIEQVETLSAQTERWGDALDVFNLLASDTARPHTTRLEAAQRFTRIASQVVQDPALVVRGLDLQLALVAPRDREPLRAQLLDALAASSDQRRWLSEALAYAQDGQDSNRRTQVLFRALELTEMSGDLNTAASCCRRLLDLNPRDEEVVRALIRVCDRKNDWPGSLDARERLLPMVYDATAQRDLLHEMALISEHLPALMSEPPPTKPSPKAAPSTPSVSANASKAAANKTSAPKPPPTPEPPPLPALPQQKPSQVYWERLLAVDPHNEEALDALTRCFQDQQRWGDLMDALQRRIWATQTDPAKRQPLLRRLASLWQIQLANPGQALEAWQQVLELAPEDHQVMRCIRDLCIETDNPEALEHILRTLSLSPGLPDPERIATLLQLAALLLERPGDRDKEAIGLAWQALKLSSTHEPAITLIESYARSRFDWPTLAHILTHRRDLLPDAVHDPFDLELTTIYTANLKDFVAAANTLTRVWYRNIGDAPTFLRLRDLYALLPGNHDQIQAHIDLSLSYASHLSQTPDAPAPSWCSPSGASKALTAALTADILRQTAAQLYDRIGLPDKALDLLLDLLPKHWTDAAVIQHSARMASASGRAWQLVQSLKRLRETLDPDTLKHFDRVLDDLFSTLAHNPATPHHTSHSHTSPPPTLATSASRTHTHTRRSSNPATPPANASVNNPQVSLLYEMAQFYHLLRHDASRACRIYEQILGLNPLHDGAHSALIDLYTKDTRWHELAHALQRRLDTLPPSAPKHQRISLTASLIDLYKNRLQRPELASALRPGLLGFSPTLLIIFALIAMTAFLVFLR